MIGGRSDDRGGRAGRSAIEVAEAIGRPLGEVVRLLDESAAAGVVVDDGQGSWRLTDEAEERFGVALRGMRPEEAE